MNRSENIDKISAALADAQAEFDRLIKDATAKIPGKDGKPGYGYTYAGLAATLEAVRPALARHKIAIVGDVETVQGGVKVFTTLSHESGQWIASSPLVMSCSPKPQDIGSAITYGRRYQLQAMLGLAAEDDDGSGAHANAPEQGPDLPPREGSRRVVRDEPKPDSIAEAYLLIKGPRCGGGKSAPLAAHVRELVGAMAEMLGHDWHATWTSVLRKDGAGIPPTVEPEQLLASDAKRLSDKLEAGVVALEAKRPRPEPPDGPERERTGPGDDPDDEVPGDDARALADEAAGRVRQTFGGAAVTEEQAANERAGQGRGKRGAR